MTAKDILKVTSVVFICLWSITVFAIAVINEGATGLDLALFCVFVAGVSLVGFSVLKL